MTSVINCIKKGFAAAVAVAMSFLPMYAVNAFADTPEREIISDDDYLAAVDSAFVTELKKLGTQTLCEGFLQSGTAESEADWYMLAARTVGREEDYEAYVSAAEEILEERLENPDGYYLTEFARTAVVIDICGGESPDLSQLDFSSAGDNEVIWYALAQKLGGYDCSAAENELALRQSDDGGFGILGDSDADVTAMALNILPSDGDEASAAVNYLSEYYSENGSEMSTETAAQMIIGLCTQGINPSQSAQFTAEDGVRLTDILLSRRTEDGFSHVDGGDTNEMATMQALTALAVLGYYSAAQRSVFDGNFVPIDLYGEENLGGEGFDDYDTGLLESVQNVQASDHSLLETLKSRANLYGADYETLSEIEEKLAKSELLCSEIESINSEIRENLYPADEVRLNALSELHEINVRIEQFSEQDRALILSADELESREAELQIGKKYLIIACCGGVLLAVAVIIYIIRKKKHD